MASFPPTYVLKIGLDKDKGNSDAITTYNNISVAWHMLCLFSELHTLHQQHSELGEEAKMSIMISREAKND